jgi:hypothetical protein
MKTIQQTLLTMIVVIVGISKGGLGQDLYFIPFDQANVLSSLAASDPANWQKHPEWKRGICWSLSLGWIDIGMTQLNGSDSSLVFKKDGGNGRVDLLKKQGGTNDFAKRYTRYLNLFDAIKKEYPEYDSDSGVRMSSRFALINMNQQLGSNYYRRIEPGMSFEFADAGDAAITRMTNVLVSADTTFMMINVRFNSGAAHTVAAFGKDKRVFLFDPNQGEDYSAKFSKADLGSWCDKIADKIAPGSKRDSISRLSCVTMTSLKK